MPRRAGGPATFGGLLSRSTKASPDAGARIARAFLDALYRDYARPLLRFISRQNIGHEEAREIVQESYCRLQQVPEVEAMESARGYLFRTAVNLARDSKRQRRREFHVASAAEIGAPADVEVPSDAPTAYQVLEGQQELAIIERAIEEAGASTCRRSVMHRFGGATYSQIASELGLSVSMIENARELCARAPEDAAGRRPCRARRAQGGAMKNHPTSNPTQEAADWPARLRSENVSEMEEVRFRAWLSGDPARRREFDALDTMWDELDRVAQSPAVLAAQQASRKNAALAAHPRFAPCRDRLGDGPPALLARLGSSRGSAGSRRATTRLSLANSAPVPLADGSIITLNTASRVSRAARLEGAAGSRCSRGRRSSKWQRTQRARSL